MATSLEEIRNYTLTSLANLYESYVEGLEDDEDALTVVLLSLKDDIVIETFEAISEFVTEINDLSVSEIIEVIDDSNAAYFSTDYVNSFVTKHRDANIDTYTKRDLMLDKIINAVTNDLLNDADNVRDYIVQEVNKRIEENAININASETVKM